jgi:hypothetical protein
MIVYYPWLLKRFKELGGKIIYKEITCLSQIYDSVNSNIIVDCSGLGAITIKGIEDDKMYPVRGQR